MLMYHAVGGPSEAPSRFVVPLQRLQRQLALLRRLRYRVVPLGELLRALEEGSVPRRTVVITFDDGYADNRDLAYPVLERLRMPASIFAVSGRAKNDWTRETPLGGRPLLRLDELRELGPFIDIGAHTRTHPMLTSLTQEEARGEIAGSRRDLEEALGRPVMLFAYPYGAYNAQVRALVEEAGFSAACTVAPGRNPSGRNRFELRRLEIEGTYSLPRFLLALWIGDTRLLRRWRARRARGAPRGVG